jgi:hypothetical protein
MTRLELVVLTVITGEAMATFFGAENLGKFGMVAANYSPTEACSSSDKCIVCEWLQRCIWLRAGCE